MAIGDRIAMVNINLSVPYQLSPDEALRRIQMQIHKVKAQYAGVITDFQESWNGNVGSFSGSAKGHTASGTITVNPGMVFVELTVPPLAALFGRGKIESEIRARLSGVLT